MTTTMLGLLPYLVFRTDIPGHEPTVRYSSQAVEVGQVIETNYAGHRCFKVLEIRPFGYDDPRDYEGVRSLLHVKKVPCDVGE